MFEDYTFTHYLVFPNFRISTRHPVASRCPPLSLSLSLSLPPLSLSRSFSLARRSLTGISNCEIRRVGNPMTGGSGFRYYFVNTLLPVLKSVSRIKNEMRLNKNCPVRKHKNNAYKYTFSLFWMRRKYIKEMKLNLLLHFHLFLWCFDKISNIFFSFFFFLFFQSNQSQKKYS